MQLNLFVDPNFYNPDKHLLSNEIIKFICGYSAIDINSLISLSNEYFLFVDNLKYADLGIGF